jgi:predicted nuclease of restriction endonuclease-like (RecB) superfamily
VSDLFVTPVPSHDYEAFVAALKAEIKKAQVQAAQSVNQTMVLLYWKIGREILARQRQEGWGTKVITRLAKDLHQEFPNLQGFSRTNLLNMRAFADSILDEEVVRAIYGKIPWGHNVRLMSLKDSAQRLWYAQKTIENGWSRNILEFQIESGLFIRQGNAVTNFEQTLPKPQSDLAQQLIKDPYSFSFLTLKETVQERELEEALVSHIRDFLLELGIGFSFVGSQYHMEVDGDDYYLDLLFYHLKLRCFVVIDLKAGEFQPEFLGKMNFYVSAVDEQLRHPDDQPTIGLILCKSKSKIKAEYALRNLQTPIAVSTHQLPTQLKENLPSVEQIEIELETVASEIIKTEVTEEEPPKKSPKKRLSRKRDRG